MTHNSDGFQYEPPDAARRAASILVKPNLGYPFAHPVTAGDPVLHAVLDGLLALPHRPHVIVVEGCCHAMPVAEIFLRRGLPRRFPSVEWLDADQLPVKPYPNRHRVVYRFGEIWAPEILEQAGCLISVAPLKRTVLKDEPLISGTVKNLFGLPPRARYRARSPHSRGQLHRPDVHKIICDLYGCLGSLFHAGVVDLTEMFVNSDWQPDRGQALSFGKVITGSSLPDVDAEACRVTAEPQPRWMRLITEAA
jgi:hypothetical protein